MIHPKHTVVLISQSSANCISSAYYPYTIDLTLQPAMVLAPLDHLVALDLVLLF